MLRIHWHGERVADIPARRLADECPVIRTPSVKPDYIVDEPVAVTDAAYPPAGGPRRGAAAAARRAQHRQQALGLGAVRLHRPGQHRADPRLRRRGAAHQGHARAASPSATTATAATATSTRTAAPRRPWPRRRATSPAPARCRWPSPTASTSATPRRARSTGSSSRPSRAWPRPARRWTRRSSRGNVSFYNESFGQAIYPTPMVGMLGVFDDVSVHIDDAFKDEGDVIVLLGAGRRLRWTAREYQKVALRPVEGRIPDVDLRARGRAAGARCAQPSSARLLKSAHDCAEGGLAVALAECCIASGSNGGARDGRPRRRRRPARRPLPRRRRGPRLRRGVTGAAGRTDLALFGEAPDARGRHLRAGQARRAARAPRRPARTAQSAGLTGAELRCTMEDEELLAVPVSELHSAYESLPQRLA